ncbi:unnamed protein product [Adineta steineri]|uniref:Uncharacterized protein n=1 Tax=Adineta steineri TaxID=433720 RepID=A0A813XLQ3_9BILA|nr:unnamed protein product [Adineta steineri]CAF0873346.1 unnamed protein product [Adineta steineri]CAF3684774.1 unnamed protein product [Adineta steineri]CAF3987326.1 unnamed protein product [Adineta steineri]
MSSELSNKDTASDGTTYGDTTGKGGTAQHGGSGGAGAPNITGTHGAPTGGGTATTHPEDNHDHGEHSEKSGDEKH